MLLLLQELCTRYAAFRGVKAFCINMVICEKLRSITNDRARLLGNFIDETTTMQRTHTQSGKNTGINNIVPTHIMLLSRDSTTFTPSVSKSCRFYSQQHVQITRRHNVHCHLDRGLMLSSGLIVCSDFHVTRCARST